jgi:hypothetical protein
MAVRRQRALALALALAAGLGPSGCDRGGSPEEPQPGGSLQLVRAVQLAVSEPSDMCLDRDGVHWWTVSDNTGRVYELRLSDCVAVDTLAYQGVDLEGIWQDPADGTLYVTEEGTREIVHLSPAGVELGRVSVDGLGGEVNSGLEGITRGPVAGRFYVVQEKNPARLVEVDAAGNVLALHGVDYVGDLSGVTYDAGAGQLLVVSDESQKVCWTSLTGDLISAWSIDVTKAEGVALDTTRSRIYVVSDDEEKFYEFRLP